jgi:hypothetical protein
MATESVPRLRVGIGAASSAPADRASKGTGHLLTPQ